MTTKFAHYPQKPNHERISNAYVILCNTHDASSSFLDIFETTRKRRNAKGASTDEEQDLLRAMLSFATSGLDSMIKQLIRDTLHFVIDKDEGATQRFRTYIEKKLMTGDQTNSKLLAKVLADHHPRNSLIQELVTDLTSTSLQSKDELLKVASYFNIPSPELTTDFDFLSTIFEARNQIVHEMDIDFNQTNRKRRSRTRADMLEYTNEILRIAKIFLQKVDTKLGQRVFLRGR